MTIAWQQSPQMEIESAIDDVLRDALAVPAHVPPGRFARKDWRRIATRYDKLARNFLAAAQLAGALYRIKL